MPLREDLEGTKKTGDIFAAAPVPCPIDCAHNMPQPVCQRTKKEQKRKTKDPFSRKRTVEGKLRCNLTLICLQVEPRTRSTWHMALLHPVFKLRLDHRLDQ